jgi:NAD(P)-dependent dehydrogenase (short-subunit alcohol dehydrogenase family)
MHGYELLQRYGPTALVTEVTDDPGEAFAAELAKGGFDLLLPSPNPAQLEPLAARLRDHEGVNVRLYEGDIHSPRFAESLYADSEGTDIGLLVCDIEPGHPQMAGSLLSSLTRVFMPRLRARQHSGVIVLDITGKARRFGETLAHELKPEGIDVLTIYPDDKEPSLRGDLSPAALAKRAIEGMDDGPVISFTPQDWCR